MSKEDNSINYFNKGGNQRLRDWLDGIIEHNEPIMSKKEELEDIREQGIIIGETELAESLLEKLDEWDEEDEENEN